MSIGIEQIEHLAKLSKLALTPEEKQKYSQQLGSILTFLDTLTLEEKKEKKSDLEHSVNLFLEEQDYSDPQSLLQNTKHPLLQNTIAIKTSLTH